MAFVRTVKHENPFVQLDKAFIGNGKLSLKATGLLTYILSKPDGWKIRMKDIQANFNDGKDSVRSAMNELMKENYVYRYQERNEKGILGDYVYLVYERPEFNPNPRKEPKAENPTSEESPKAENPTSGNPTSENPTYNNNESSNIDINNNDNKELLFIEELLTRNPVTRSKRIQLNNSVGKIGQKSLYSLDDLFIQSTFKKYSEIHKIPQSLFFEVLDEFEYQYTGKGRNFLEEIENPKGYFIQMLNNMVENIKTKKSIS